MGKPCNAKVEWTLLGIPKVNINQNKMDSFQLPSFLNLEQDYKTEIIIIYFKTNQVHEGRHSWKGKDTMYKKKVI